MKAYYLGYVSGLSCLTMAMMVGGTAAIAETQTKFSDTLTQNVGSSGFEGISKTNGKGRLII